MHRRRFLFVALAVAVAASTVLTTGSAFAADDLTIGGDIYTGDSSVRYLFDLADPAGEPTAVYDNCVHHTPAGSLLSPLTGLPLTLANGSPDPGPPGGPAACPPLVGARVLVQNQHSGGGFITYGTVTGNSWTATVDKDLYPDIIVTFSAPGHDTTSREFTWDAAAASYTHPIPGLAGTGGATGIRVGGNRQDAYLPPLTHGKLPSASLLHYVFYDKFVNGNDNGPLVDPGLNCVTVNVYDEEGTLLQSRKTGDVNNDGKVDENDTFTTTDGIFYGPGGEPVDGYVYFEGLPAGEVIVESDPLTVTKECNPHFSLYIEDDVARNTAGWSLTYTEEGGSTWDPKLWPGFSGTEAGTYYTWHGFIEKIGQVGSLHNPTEFNRGITGRVEVTLLDADGNDPEELFPTGLPGRVTGGYPNGLDVEPNARIMNGAVALYTKGDFPELVATGLASQPTGQNDQNGAKFTFLNVPPGQYELFAYDVPLYNVPLMGIGVTVNPGRTVRRSLLLPRFGARAQGYVMNGAVPVAGATVKAHYKSGITKKETTTDATGYFNFDFLPEVEVLGHVFVELPDGSTIRGKIITEDFDPDGPGGLPSVAVTHNAMNRYVQWATFNYWVDIQVEDIPAATGDINGVVFYDHLARGSWVGDGIYDEHEEPILHGVTVELYDAAGTSLLATTTTGAFSKADTIAEGWQEPYTWPPNEIGGVFAGPATFDGSAPSAPRVGMYEFRDLAPGDYMVKVLPPTGYKYSPSPASTAGGEPAAVAGGMSTRVDVGANTTAGGAAFGVPRAGEVEGGVFDDAGPLDPNPLSLLFDEKAGIVGAPVGVYDHNDYFLGVMFMGDPLCYSGSTVCPSPFPVLGQKPEAERRFAPGVHRYLGNDPGFCEDVNGNGVLDAGEDVNGNGNLDCFNSDFTPMELPYTFPQGGFKFEADWSLLLNPGTQPTADVCVTSMAVSDTGPGYPWGASVDVTVFEDTGIAPGIPVLSPVTVSGTWSTGEGGSAVTGAGGTATVTLAQVQPDTTADLTFTVNSVTGPTWYVFNSMNTTISGCLYPPTSDVIANPGDGGGGGGGVPLVVTGVGINKGEGKWFGRLTIIGDPGVKITYSFDGGESKRKKIGGGGTLRVRSETIENGAITSISYTVTDGVNTVNGTISKP